MDDFLWIPMDFLRDFYGIPVDFLWIPMDSLFSLFSLCIPLFSTARGAFGDDFLMTLGSLWMTFG